MGSTETQRSVSFLRIPAGSSLTNEKEIIPAGVGMKDVQLLVLNKQMQSCGIGEIGELYMRSHHMAKGWMHFLIKIRVWTLAESEKFFPERLFGPARRDERKVFAQCFRSRIQ